MKQYCDRTLNTRSGKFSICRYLPNTVDSFRKAGDGIEIYQNAVVRGGVTLGDSVIIREFCNIYGKAIIGNKTRVGAYTEIGNAIIGDNVVIGAKCFIPAGVMICDNAWIAPMVTFTNDRYPPSPKERWEATLIESGAKIGAGTIILCGVIIGYGSLVGCGSVVTKSIPPNQRWAGNPARRIA